MKPKISDQDGGSTQDLVPRTVKNEEFQCAQSFPSKAHHYDNIPHQTFHLFPRLPLELREMIWTYLLPGPRLIEVYSERTYYFPEVHCRVPCENPRGRHFHAANPHRPTLLQVSQESKRVVLRAFKYCFTLKNAHEMPTSACKAHFQGVLFQPALDTIYFRSENRASLTKTLLNPRLPAIEMSNIQSFAVDDWGVNGHRGGPDSFFPFLLSPAPAILCGLRELFLIRLALQGVLCPAAEDKEDIRWETWVKTALARLTSPLEPRVRVLRKPKLWNGEGDDNMPWVATPHWMARAVLERARENAVRRFAVLGDRANLPPSAL